MPSGLHAHDHTRPSCPSTLATSSPVVTSHTRTVPSNDVEASWVPSRLHAHDVTGPPCPSSVANSCPVLTSHTRTVLSRDAEVSPPQQRIAFSTLVSPPGVMRPGAYARTALVSPPGVYPHAGKQLLARVQRHPGVRVGVAVVAGQVL